MTSQCGEIGDATVKSNETANESPGYWLRHDGEIDANVYIQFTLIVAMVVWMGPCSSGTVL